MINRNLMKAIFLAAISLLASSVPALANSCKAYPYHDGIDREQIAQNKLVATASASVSFDDIDAVKDAREEATLEAKATLVKFLTEEIQSDSVIAKLVSESKTLSGIGKESIRKEAITRTKLLRNRAQALLRGVIVLGDCYTKGSEVRVTVGVKPETINAALGLADGMAASVGNQPTGGSKSSSNRNAGGRTVSPSGATQQPLSNVGEYSNTKNLKKF